MSDLVSRSYLLAEYDRQHKGTAGKARKIIEEAPPAESEIIYCKDCAKHGKRFDEYPASEACPLTVWRVAEGHECDYQFCVYAERRTDE